jgi:uroporphyrin-III C-methyltransferase
LRNEALSRDVRDHQNRVALLEAKQAELQNQRLAIEEMTRDLARAPEDWLLAEIEQTLNIASRELTLAGNVRAAIAALQTIDQRLARADKLQATPLRRAVTQDLERLKATPALDTQGIIVKLDQLIAQAAALPLVVPTNLAADTVSNTAAAETDRWAQRAWRDFVNEMKNLVRVRELGANEASLITPQQGAFVRESLKLRLLSARTSLLARDEVNFKEDLRAAHQLLTRYFDPKARANQIAQTNLKSLAENRLSIAAPDITQSMNAVRAARELRQLSAAKRP